jgi:hypothetical protein
MALEKRKKNEIAHTYGADAHGSVEIRLIRVIRVPGSNHLIKKQRTIGGIYRIDRIFFFQILYILFILSRKKVHKL